MVYGIYILLLLISIGNLIYLILNYKEYVSVFYVIMFVAVLVSNLGYLQMIMVNNLGGAICANQFVYLGGCFIPPLMLICIAELCKYTIPRWAKMAVFAGGFLMFSLVTTIGYLPLYYKKIEIRFTDHYTYYAKEYGPLHSVFFIFLIGLMLGCFVVVALSFRRKKQISHMVSIFLLVCVAVIVLTYVLEKIFNSRLPLMPLGYVVIELGILLALQKIRIYNLSAVFVDSVQERREYGFLALDKKQRFAGANDTARSWFPEINDLQVDKALNREKSEFFSQICQWMEKEDMSTDSLILWREERAFKITYQIIYGKDNGLRAHCIRMEDDTEHQKYIELVEKYNKDLRRDVWVKTNKLEQIQEDIIISLASIVENRDSSTGGHIQRTSQIVEAFLKYLMKSGEFPQLTPEVAECIRKAAPLHDVGKIGVPDNILNKPGKFSPEEYEKMKVHSEKGAVMVGQILENSQDMMFKNIAVNIAHYHHEKWDGTGYPAKLKGEEIPFEARIMALADVYDALVSERVYKRRYSFKRAYHIIEDACGTHFDPKLCRAFLDMLNLLEEKKYKGA